LIVVKQAGRELKEVLDVFAGGEEAARFGARRLGFGIRNRR
jgi:hypothetical protein